MSKIKLFSDSNVDLPQEYLEEMGVSVLPMNIVIDDKSYLDKLEITARDIIDYGETKKRTPKTASPTLEKTIEILSNLEEDEYGIFFLISSKVSSSTHMIVKNAIDYLNLNSRVKIIDSKSLSGGTGLLIIETYRLMNSGLAFEDLVEAINIKVDKLHTGFVIDSLDYLYYGGRCSQMDLLFSSKFKIRPLINLIDGEMKVVKKYRGNLKKVTEKYVKELENIISKVDSNYIVISHTHMEDPMILYHLVESINKLNYFKEIIVADASATITSHGGPNTIGLFYYMK